MNIIFRILPAIALCAALTACGDSNTSTTTTTDTAVLSDAPIGAPASDNNGAGVEGGTINTSTSGGATGTNGSGGSGSSSSSGDNVNGSKAGNANDAATTPDRTKGRNNAGTRSTAEDSINNRTGLAPVK